MDCKEEVKSEDDEFPKANTSLIHHKLIFSERKLTLKRETMEQPYVETFFKIENCAISTELEKNIKTETNKHEYDMISTKLDTDSKTENIKCENNSRTDNSLDSYPPDSYHFLLQRENDLCKYVTKVKEEKPFHFKDSIRLKTEDGPNLSSQIVTLPSGQNNQYEQLFFCIMCNKTFKKKSLISKHLRKHIGSRPFSCSVCKKSFTLKTHLTQHEQIHSGSQPFSCSVCNKSFARKTHLTQHEKIHSASRPFSCSVCNKSFTRSSHLAQHEKIHKRNRSH